MNPAPPVTIVAMFRDYSITSSQCIAAVLPSRTNRTPSSDFTSGAVPIRAPVLSRAYALMLPDFRQATLALSGS